MPDATLGELLAAHPEWQQAANLPDFLTVNQIAVYCHKHPQTVRQAMLTGQLRATQHVKAGDWSAELEDVQQWKRGLTPRPRAAGTPPRSVRTGLRAVPAGRR
jgi:hypothetical protein